MGSFGERFRREREQRGVSLEDVAKVTKIGTRLLKALEDENFDVLPGGIFNKGFVRSYARFLGISEDEMITAYQTSCNEQPLSVERIAAQSAMAKASRLAAQQAHDSERTQALLRNAAILALGFALLFGAYLSYRRGYIHAWKLRHPQRSSQAQAHLPQTTAPVHAPLTQPSPTTPLVPSPSNPGALTATATPQSDPAIPANGFVVSIRTSEESWLSITADGHRALQKTFAPHEQQSITATSQVNLIVGNPGGTQLSLNGKPLILRGDPERPQRLVLNAAGIVSE